MDKKLIGRRDFIKSSAIGMASLICLPSTKILPNESQGERKLVYRTLGNTGIRIPVIGMGILASGSPGLMRAALDAGITHFDSTAGQPQQIRNEEMIGEVLKDRRRDSVIFGTKIHLAQDSRTGLYTKSATESDFLKKLDMALKRLKMDYVDIVYHHMVSRRESAFHEPAMRAMEKAKKAGKARFLGITTHGNVPEVVNAAADSKFYEVVMASYNNRQNDHKLFKDAFANAADKGLGVVAIKVIRGGLSGDEKVSPIASLKWVLQDPNVHATVPGFGNFKEMSDDLSVMGDLNLNESDRNDLKRAVSIPGLYCQGCGQCMQQCPDNLPIPDMMRAYMYAYGYREPELARSLVSSLALPRDACENCDTCFVACQNGWDIGEKIRDIARFRDVPSRYFV